MLTRDHSEFYSKQQRFVFIVPEVEINPQTNLPYDREDYCVVDVDDLITIGTPMHDDEELEFWAVLEPGEEI